MRFRSRMKRFLILVIMVIVLLGLYFGYEYLQNTSLGEYDQETTANTGFPLSFAGDKIIKLTNVSNNLVVLTAKQLAFYTDKGRETVSYQHGGESPMIKTDGKYTVYYEIGGNKVNVYNNTNKQMQYPTEFANQILFCEITREGYLAVVTRHEKSSALLTLYDPKGSEYYKWTVIQERIAGLVIQKNGMKGAALIYGVKNGTGYSKIVGMDFTKEAPVFETEIKKSIGYSIEQKNSGNYHIISDDKLIAINTKGEIVTESKFPSSVQYLSNEKVDFTAIVTGNNENEINTLKIYDNSGEETNEFITESNITNVFT